MKTTKKPAMKAMPPAVDADGDQDGDKASMSHAMHGAKLLSAIANAHMEHLSKVASAREEAKSKRKDGGRKAVAPHLDGDEHNE